MKILQLIDSLHAGGAERIAVNFANELSEHIEGSFICTTREEGLLKQSVSEKVNYLFLEKKSTFDFKAVNKLSNYINKNEIDIIHAHSSSYFLASQIKLVNKKIKIIWHDHHGNRLNASTFKNRIIKFSSRSFSHIFCVNNELKLWAESYLKHQSVSYLPNFATYNISKPLTTLKGNEGKRMVCLANLRPVKDHLNLINAFAIINKNYPEWTLHIVGNDYKDSYSDTIKKTIKEKQLTSNVYIYGSVPDVSCVLDQCNIGVLSSKSEGLPVALLEYGLSKLAVVTTNVGDCSKVIINSEEGFLVPPDDSLHLAEGLLNLINNPIVIKKTGEALYQKINANYSSSAIVKKLIVIYKNSCSNNL